MPIGNPIRKQNESRIVSVLATEGQTVFTVQGGYLVNQISVFRNGVRLSNSEDFTAGDGSTVTLNNAANIEDRIEFHIFDRFTVQNAIVGAASSQTISGDLVVNGKVFGNLQVSNVNTGIVTATELDLNGNANISGVSTFQNNVHLLDSDRLQIGGSAGTVDGIELYHDGSHSYIADSGTGELRLRASVFNVQNAAGDETLIGATSDDSVALYFNNNQKLVTTNTGAVVTGILTATDFSGAAGAAADFPNGLTGTTGTFSGDVSIADKIIHTGDTDTTIRFPSADTIRFDTGGTEAARITSEQKFVIGDTNSTAQLGVVRDSYNLAEFTNTNADATGAELSLRKDSASPADNDSLGTLNFIGDNDAGQKTTYTYIQSKSTDVSDGTEDGDIRFFTRGAGTLAERLRIDSSGDINIHNRTAANTSDPITVDFGGQYTPQGDITQQNLKIKLFSNAANNDSMGITAGNDGVTYVSSIYTGHIFYTTPSSINNLAERLRITSAGSVGIGSTIPTGMLEVQSGGVPAIISNYDNQKHIQMSTGGSGGGLNISSDAYFALNHQPFADRGTNSNLTERVRVNTDGQFLINTTVGTGAYHLVVANPSNSDTGMTFRGGGSSQQRIRFADGTSGGAESVGQVEYNHADNSLAIDTNGAEAVRIDSSGRVMIQTTTEGHADSDDLTIGDTGDSRIGITLRSSEYGNIFFSDATSGAAEYQGVLQYYHVNNAFNLSIGGGTKVTVASQNIALFGDTNMSPRGGVYYGVDLAYKGSGIQGRSNNPTLDLCSNVSANSAGNGYVYGEGNTTAGQLSVGGRQLIFSAAASGTAGAAASLQEKFRFNDNATMIFGSTTSNAPNGSVHIANAFLRLQAKNQNSGDFSQQVGIEWSQESGSDVQVCAIKARRTSWGGAPHALDFYTRHASNSVVRAFILTETQSATLTGSLTQNASDIRLKGDIQPITNALEKVNSLSGFTFNWNQKGKDLGFTGGDHDDLQVGLSAQDVEKIQPEVIKPAPISDEYKTIQYEKLVPLLVESIKELSTKNDALEARLAALEGS